MDEDPQLVARMAILQMLCPEMATALRRTDWWGTTTDLYVCRFFGLPAGPQSYRRLKMLALEELHGTRLTIPFNKEGELVGHMWQLLKDCDMNTCVYTSDEEKRLG